MDELIFLIFPYCGVLCKVLGSVYRWDRKADGVRPSRGCILALSKYGFLIKVLLDIFLRERLCPCRLSSVICRLC